jgi:hypothetical protein
VGPAEWPEFRPQALLARLVGAGVDFVVVGGLAAVIHGSATITRDLDITYASDPGNLERLHDTLDRLGARPRAALVPGERTLPLTSRDGWIDLVAAASYPQLRQRAVPAELGGVTVLVASLDDLIAMKKAAGRPKDLVAVEELEAIQRLQRELG